MPKSIVSVENVTFTYPGAEKPVLENASLEVEEGAFAAVIGNNGSGKTTLCKTFNGIIPHFITGDFSGTVKINGQNTLASTVAALAKNAAYVYQDFENQLVRSTVYEDVIFAALNFGYEDYRQRGMRALELLGLEGLRDKFIWELSGGQKHMVALAGVLSMDPGVIIIDEPAAQLDPLNAVQVYDKLKMLNQDMGKTIIVIEHHTEFIADYCRSVILMRDGGIAWQKPVQEALNQLEELKRSNIYPPQVTQAAQLVSDGASGRLPVTLSEGRAFFGGFSVKPRAAADCSQTVQPGGKPVVEIHEVTQIRSASPKPILDNISLTIYEGDRLAIVGNNGAGKTTLLKLISGIIKPNFGGVRVCGTPTRKTSPGELAGSVAYVYQNPEDMFIEDSVRRDAEYSLKSRKHPQTAAIVDEVIGMLHLAELQHRDGRLLSGGQQRRVSLAIGIATRPAVILLDEPTCSLDISSRREMVALLDALRDWVRTAVVATHDMQLAAEWANRIIVMRDGRIIEDTGREVFENPRLLSSANLRPPQIVEMSQLLDIRPVACSPAEFAARLTV